MSLVNRIAGFVANALTAEPPKEQKNPTPQPTKPEPAKPAPDRDEYVDGGRNGRPVRSIPARPESPEPSGGAGRRW